MGGGKLNFSCSKGTVKHREAELKPLKPMTQINFCRVWITLLRGKVWIIFVRAACLSQSSLIPFFCDILIFIWYILIYSKAQTKPPVWLYLPWLVLFTIMNYVHSGMPISLEDFFDWQKRGIKFHISLISIRHKEPQKCSMSWFLTGRYFQIQISQHKTSNPQ